LSIKIFSLISEVHDCAAIDESLKPFINGIELALNDKLIEAPLEEIKDDALCIIFVKSGGVEDKFKKLFSRSKARFVLLTSNMHNSLPAAMEILSYINSSGKTGEILHSTAAQITKRLSAMIKAAAAKRAFKNKNIGIIGKPSDWLIASDISYRTAEERFGFKIVDISMTEVLAEYKKKHEIKNKRLAEILKKGYCEKTLNDSLNLYESLKAIAARYQLSAFTIRCFDLLGAIKNTGCLALALLNGEGITAGCEGDVPALISMMIVNELGGVKSFMANPSSIDIEKNTAVFAHCTVPLEMTDGFELDSHFESRLGVAISGNIPLGGATIFKISNSLDRYWVSPAEILSNPKRENLCRTQVETKIAKGVDYFLKRPFGNHHVIAVGNHSELIDEFFGA